jgi:hypothetical protein
MKELMRFVVENKWFIVSILVALRVLSTTPKETVEDHVKKVREEAKY